jgi:hypothetical protein
MFFLKLLLADTEALEIMKAERHRVTNISSVSDVLEDLPFRQGSNIFGRAAVVLGFEEKVSGGPLGGITEYMSRPDLPIFANLFLRVEFQNPKGEGNRIGGKSGTGLENSIVVGEIKGSVCP